MWLLQHQVPAAAAASPRPSSCKTQEPTPPRSSQLPQPSPFIAVSQPNGSGRIPPRKSCPPSPHRLDLQPFHWYVTTVTSLLFTKAGPCLLWESLALSPRGTSSLNTNPVPTQCRGHGCFLVSHPLFFGVPFPFQKIEISDTNTIERALKKKNKTL